jgi:hypothetical protein
MGDNSNSRFNNGYPSTSQKTPPPLAPVEEEGRACECCGALLYEVSLVSVKEAAMTAGIHSWHGLNRDEYICPHCVSRYVITGRLMFTAGDYLVLDGQVKKRKTVSPV